MGHHFRSVLLDNPLWRPLDGLLGQAVQCSRRLVQACPCTSVSTNIPTITRILHLACRKLLFLRALQHPRSPRTTRIDIGIAHSFRNPNDTYDPSKLHDGRYRRCAVRASNKVNAPLAQETYYCMNERRTVRYKAADAMLSLFS